MKPFRYRLRTRSPRETVALGERLAAQLEPDRVLALYGDLAAGKTTLSKGICSYLNADQPATSPTLTLINEYRGDLPVFHFDCYRIKHPDEILLLGFEEYLEARGIVLIEWPERIAQHLPADSIDIFMRVVNEHTRDIEILSPVELELL